MRDRYPLQRIEVRHEFWQWVAIAVILLMIEFGLIMISRSIDRLTDGLQHIQVHTVSQPEPTQTVANG